MSKNVLFIPTRQAFRSTGRLPVSAAAKNNLERPVDSHMTAVSMAYKKACQFFPEAAQDLSSFPMAHLLSRNCG